MKRKYFILALVCVSFFQQMNALRLPTARYISGGIGVGTTALSYYLFSKKQGTILPPALLSVMTGAVAGGISYYILKGLTPEGRFECAQNYINRAMSNPIAIQTLSEGKEFFEALQEVYVADDLWLVGAYNDLSNLLVGVRRALELLEMVRVEAADDSILVQNSNALSSQGRKALKNLTTAVKQIRNDKEYIEQLKLYKQMLMEEKKLQVQKEIAQAEKEKAKAQTSIAQSQKERTDIEGIKTAIQIQQAQVNKR